MLGWRNGVRHGGSEHPIAMASAIPPTPNEIFLRVNQNLSILKCGGFFAYFVGTVFKM